jgi:hypothetical protein
MGGTAAVATAASLLDTRILDTGAAVTNGDAADVVARWLYERVKPHFGGKYRDFPVLRRRVRDLILEFKDVDMVATVCAEIIGAQRGGFNALHSLTFYHFIFVRNGLGYPPGAWRFARWYIDERDKTVRASIDHWLSRWRDAIEAGDMGVQLNAARMLGRLDSERGATL